MYEVTVANLVRIRPFHNLTIGLSEKKPRIGTPQAPFFLSLTWSQEDP